MIKQNSFNNLILLLFVMSLCACTSNEDFRISNNPELVGLAGPVSLNSDSTVIELSDYFRHPKSIDSVFLNKSISYRFSTDSAQLILTIKDKNLPKISVMSVFADGFSYSLLLERSTKKWHQYSFDPGDKVYENVEITGDAGRHSLRFRDGKWKTDIFLYPGRYEYQLLVNGKQIPDPGNPEKSESLFGGWSSVFSAGLVNPQGTPYLYTNTALKDQVSIGIINNPAEVFVFWQNHQLDSTFWKPDSTGITIRIPRKAKDFSRSFIRVWAYNSAGISNEVLIPVRDGKILIKPENLTREDKEAMIIYFLMVDRFYNGNVSNDSPVKDSLLDKRLNFQGGDFAGILDKIEDNYFKGLGVNTLWISPVIQNPNNAWPDFNQFNRRSTGYHGYWPVSLTQTDKRFGSSDEFQSLVEEAHSNDLNVLLDFVSNRIHKESPIYLKHPEWTTPMNLPDSKKKNIRLWEEHPYTTWWEEYIPTLDLTNPDVYSMMSDSALFWIKAFEIDGFRHDAVNHLPEAYLRVLTRKLKENVTIPDNRPVFQIGEFYGNREELSKYLNPGKLDALFDFNLFQDAGKTFALDNSSFRDLNSSLKQSMNIYGDHSLMGNISGNHDLPRFISYASGAIVPGENYLKSGWEKNIEVTDTIAYKKLTSFLAFNMTIPGVPVIYYGDEIGLPGAGNPDNRRMMRFDSLNNQELQVKNITSKLINLRKNTMPFIYGDFTVIEVSDKVYIYMRSYFDKVAFVVFNKNRVSQHISFEVPQRFKNLRIKKHFSSDAVLEKNTISLDLKGNSFEIITN